MWGLEEFIPLARSLIIVLPQHTETRPDTGGWTLNELPGQKKIRVQYSGSCQDRACMHPNCHVDYRHVLSSYVCKLPLYGTSVVGLLSKYSVNPIRWRHLSRSLSAACGINDFICNLSTSHPRLICTRVGQSKHSSQDDLVALQRPQDNCSSDSFCQSARLDPFDPFGPNSEVSVCLGRILSVVRTPINRSHRTLIEASWMDFVSHRQQDRGIRKRELMMRESWED